MENLVLQGLVRSNANPICIGVSTLTVAHQVIARALIERGFMSRPCPLYALQDAIEHWVSKGFQVIAVGVNCPLPYRVERIELFLKDLKEPIHPIIHPISGDRCARCSRHQAPNFQYLGNAIVSISDLPVDLPEHYAKFLIKAQSWVMRNLCIKCSSKMQRKYGPVEVRIETDAEFMARVARNYPQAFEFDDSQYQQLSLIGTTDVRHFLPPVSS